MTVTDQTTIELDTTVPLVRIGRAFDAPPDLVFAAHTDPDLIVRWLGPSRHEMVLDHWDCRDGGSYRYVHRSDGNDYRFRGCFHTVRPAELIVQTFEFEGMPGHIALERAAFEAIDDGRTRLVVTSLVDSFAERDAFVASGMEEGVREGYQRLDALLAG